MAWCAFSIDFPLMGVFLLLLGAQNRCLRPLMGGCWCRVFSKKWPGPQTGVHLWEVSASGGSTVFIFISRFQKELLMKRLFGLLATHPKKARIIKRVSWLSPSQECPILTTRVNSFGSLVHLYESYESYSEFTSREKAYKSYGSCNIFTSCCRSVYHCQLSEFYESIQVVSIGQPSTFLHNCNHLQFQPNNSSL